MVVTSPGLLLSEQETATATLTQAVAPVSAAAEGRT